MDPFDKDQAQRVWARVTAGTQMDIPQMEAPPELAWERLAEGLQTTGALYLGLARRGGSGSGPVLSVLAKDVRGDLACLRGIIKFRLGRAVSASARGCEIPRGLDAGLKLALGREQTHREEMERLADPAMVLLQKNSLERSRELFILLGKGL